MPTKRVLRVSSPKPQLTKWAAAVSQRHSPSDAARAPPPLQPYIRRGRKECAAPPTIAKRAKETNAPSENGGMRRAMGRKQGTEGGNPTRSRSLNLISFLTKEWRLPQNNGDDHSVDSLWRTCGGHDNGRHVTPSIYIEKLLRAAPVKDPAAFFRPEHFMTKCLDVPYLASALNLLIDEGLLEEKDAQRNVVSKAWNNHTPSCRYG